MKLNYKCLQPQGQPVPPKSLKIERAKQFYQLLREAGDTAFASVEGTRCIAELSAESVVFTVNVERPRLLAHDIRRIELLEAVFFEDDSRAPEVNCLREDFPQAPHQNLTGQLVPKQLCLNEQAWCDARLNWTGGRFLERIRQWLARTATGMLHAADQPLEPLLAPSGAKLILPSDFSIEADYQSRGLLDVGRIQNGSKTIVLLADWRSSSNTSRKGAAAAVFNCPPQQHGVIRRQPENLHELQELCEQGGFDLAALLAERIQTWQLNKPDPKILDAELILVLLLPKTRDGTKVESIETVGFLTGKSIKYVGEKLGVLQNLNGNAGYIIGAGKTIPGEALRQVPVGMLHVHKKLNSAFAASMNGAEHYVGHVCAIGMGSLGAQIFNNLIRSGFGGGWKLIDPDILLPHNCARHFLGDWAVGTLKVEAMAAVANAILDGEPIAVGIPCDVLSPGDDGGKISEALKQSSVVCDFSASVAVARWLSQDENGPRRLVAYLSPTGNSLALGIEDKNRVTRLDWLEMLHYRAILNESLLHNSLLSKDSHIRYGNSCRDISVVVSQDDVVKWSGVASKEIKKMVLREAASFSIYLEKDDGSSAVVPCLISSVHEFKIWNWTIRLDVWTLEKSRDFRCARLPNETGGVILGHFDTHSKICSIVDILPSPPDSQEWPMSYIRGCEGLGKQVQDIGERTLGQIGYVGEWHSHPDNCSVMPSGDDMQAYGWLDANMRAEGLPAIMLIIGEKEQWSFVVKT
jgi:integrative and conjugative element protein (TIGR02256 family)